MSYIKNLSAFQSIVGDVFADRDARESYAHGSAIARLAEHPDLLAFARYTEIVERIAAAHAEAGPARDVGTVDRLLLIAAWLSTYNGYHREAEALLARVESRALL
jgi:hypothetical protein